MLSKVPLVDNVCFCLIRLSVQALHSNSRPLVTIVRLAVMNNINLLTFKYMNINVFVPYEIFIIRALLIGKPM